MMYRFGNKFSYRLYGQKLVDKRSVPYCKQYYFGRIEFWLMEGSFNHSFEDSILA